nr:unnamed protein product [Callosobruchus chinensis]
MCSSPIHFFHDLRIKVV